MGWYYAQGLDNIAVDESNKANGLIIAKTNMI
jgi:hypothetical protein